MTKYLNLDEQAKSTASDINIPLGSLLLEAFLGIESSACRKAAEEYRTLQQSNINNDIEVGTTIQPSAQQFTFETVPNWARYHRFINTEIVHFFGFVGSIVFYVGLIVTDWLGGNAGNTAIWNIVVCLARLYWIVQYLIHYPKQYAMRYHKDNLYQVNHLIGHDQSKAVYFIILICGLQFLQRSPHLFIGVGC
eukprot:UN01145